ncbi:hypothetical protein DXG01_013521 [Tephrocybe rancida]|nr:hypothetical protein DXG01_013521 [Tephrocybe rancida]
MNAPESASRMFDNQDESATLVSFSPRDPLYNASGTPFVGHPTIEPLPPQLVLPGSAKPDTIAHPDKPLGPRNSVSAFRSFEQSAFGTPPAKFTQNGLSKSFGAETRADDDSGNASDNDRRSSASSISSFNFQESAATKSACNFNWGDIPGLVEALARANALNEGLNTALKKADATLAEEKVRSARTESKAEAALKEEKDNTRVRLAEVKTLAAKAELKAGLLLEEERVRGAVAIENAEAKVKQLYQHLREEERVKTLEGQKLSEQYWEDQKARVLQVFCCLILFLPVLTLLLRHWVVAFVVLT